MWEAFEKAVETKKRIAVTDLPVPHTRSFTGVSKEEFKELAKRWHPDKFVQRYGDKIAEDEAQKVLEAVKEIFQALNAAR